MVYSMGRISVTDAVGPSRQVVEFVHNGKYQTIAEDPQPH